MQPANSFSSLAFVMVGALILIRARNTESRLSGVVLIFLGLGSAYYHARLTFGGQFVDVLGMYLIATLAVAHAVNRRWSLSGFSLSAVYLALNAALAAVLFWIPLLRRGVFGVIVIALLVLERGHLKELRRAAIILGVAFVIWIIDYYRIVCDPSSLLQGHAVWHMLGAIASWYLFTDYLNKSGALLRKQD